MPHRSVPMQWRRIPERYNLMGCYCKTCGQEFFPSRTLCPECGVRGELIEKEMPRQGKIVSWTKVFVGPEGFEKMLPYYLALIELSNKARVLAQVVDSEEKAIRIGAKVQKVFRKIVDPSEEGVISYGYKFKVSK